MTQTKTLHGEIEFEFHDNAEGGGEFVACGKVIQSLMMYLSHDQIDEAARLLAACTENVGDDLIDNFTQGGSSEKNMAALAKMFFKAKDFGRAATCAGRLGDHEKAAELLEANHELERAAESYLKAGNLNRAGALFERNLSFNKAAEIYLRTRDYARAAENLERGRQYLKAGQIYLKMSRWDRAMEALKKVERSDPHFADAAVWLGHLLERSGNPELALQMYIEAVRGRPVSHQTLAAYLRVVHLFCTLNKKRQARDLLRRVLAFSPDDPKALALAEQLRAPTDEELGEDIVIDVEEGQQDSAAHIVQKIADTLPVVAKTDRMVAVDRDFEFLRRVPLFERFALDELKYVQGVCEKVEFPPGDFLIRQGRPGDALYVVIRGTVDVLSTSPDGRRTRLVELGPGAHIGEMSLMDDAPTSADVVARQGVLAFRLARERFQELIRGNQRIQIGFYSVMVSTLAKRLREANAKLAARS